MKNDDLLSLSLRSMVLLIDAQILMWFYMIIWIVISNIIITAKKWMYGVYLQWLYVVYVTVTIVYLILSYYAHFVYDG